MSKDKIPLIKWTEYQNRHATAEEVDEWFTKFADAQIGIVTGAISGIVVVDVEAGGSIEPYPETVTVGTGGGGFHLYYKYPDHEVKNLVRVKELTDVRGDGGYVVAPPSESSKGKYQWLIAPQDLQMPLYPENLLNTDSQVAVEIAEKSSELIPVGERNVSAAKEIGRMVSKLPEDMWQSVAWPAIVSWNNTKLVEPLPHEELQKVFTSITAERRNEVGDKEFTLKPFTLRELYAQQFPPIQWLVKDLVPLGVLGAFTGESNSFKSFLTLALAQSIATGTPFLGRFNTIKGKVLIIDEENNRRIIEKRFKDMGIEAHDHIVFLSQTGIQLDKENHLKKLLKLIDELKPQLIVIDSLVRIHGKDENSSNDMRQIMRAFNSLVTEERSVLFIHHHKKEQGYSRKSSSGSLRGSSDIFAALDFHLAVERRNGDDLTIRMLKLRVEKEAEPFKVKANSEPQGGLSFIYEGEDTSRQDRINEVKESILELLSGAAEEVSKKTILDEVGFGVQMTTEALRLLTEDGLISYRRGAKGKHLFSIPDDSPAPDVEPDEETSEEVIY